MLNGRRTIGVFLCKIAGDGRNDICRALHAQAKKRGIDLIYFNMVGIIGADCDEFGKYEDRILDVIPFDKLDGVLFDNNNQFMESVRDRIRKKLMEVSCPVICIGEPCDDFPQVHFDNSIAIREFVDRFVNTRGITSIGYMSGPKGQPDAMDRLRAFRESMVKNGLPQDGAGVFYGDFWYTYGRQAAEYFASLPGGCPRAVICANDHMAISLCDAFTDMGIAVPEQVCVTGYDDVAEASQHSPSITTVAQDKNILARTIFDLFENADKGIPERTYIPTTNIYRTSCGCPDPTQISESRNESFHKNLGLMYNIYDAQAAMLEMAANTDIHELGAAFERRSLNFGPYSKFFFFAYTDREGRCSYEREMTAPTHDLTPAVWIDRTGTSVRPGEGFTADDFLPANRDTTPHCCYVTHIHFGEHCFGYTAITMDTDVPFNEFYNIWTVNIAVSLETLLQRNSVRSLISDLERESTHDRLTGLYNRKGFEKMLNSRIHENSGSEEITAVMIDLDRLKEINDIYGHSEGDAAISAIGHIISEECPADAICGRTGGDEFYVVTNGCDRERAEDMVMRIRTRIKAYNEYSGKKYTLGASFGTAFGEASDRNETETILRAADKLMYEEKRNKKVQRS
ncbi:MAG: GGDEF domain-containing protein [Oscillospiraceae bacterium]|nr:GGDEF domain-containing protein [Oscillospiraceae bacterium]